jgi:hypothetical protein
MERENYLVQPQYYQERAEDSILQDAIYEKWQLIDYQNIHANIAQHLWYNTDNQEFVLVEDIYPRTGNYLMSNNVISSAFLLYRLMSMKFYPRFPQNGEEDECYKSIWGVSLKHKTSGQILNFNDYKAGWHLGMIYSRPSEMPSDFKEDVLQLLNFLISNQIVHPYDLTISGSVA